MMNTALNFNQPPLQAWNDPVFKACRLKVDVLRLDKMHLILGGNKWMKLRGFLQKAVAEGKAGILTKGGPWSNHIHACAWACMELRLPLQVWIKGHAGLQNAMLADVQSWGVNIQFINRNQFYDESAAGVFAAENNLQYIPMGGADEPGVQESSRFLQELHLPTYNYAVCGVGTATTFGGLAFVPHNFATIVGIDAGTADQAVSEKIKSWQKQLLNKKLILNQDYSFSGFARHTPALIHFANQLYLESAMPTDIVYTAKLMYAVKSLAQVGFFKEESSVMVLHSGGLQGNRSLPAETLQF